jgi:putative glycerol-1-phosphate prenyltransferase
MYKGREAIWTKMSSKTGQLAVLIDPEKSQHEAYLRKLVKQAEFAAIDYFFIGGSTVTQKEMHACVSLLKKLTHLPVILFPGASHQISPEADGILFLNLVSGRNPDFLIGHQVAAASELHQIDIEIIPTGYLLIDGGVQTSVQYMSQTTPIPHNQFSIALNTCLASAMMGQRMLYLDAGSGAKQPVPAEWIGTIRKETGLPVIVGGGIRDIQTIKNFQTQGANVLVIGNHIEENLDFLLDLKNWQSIKFD